VNLKHFVVQLATAGMVLAVVSGCSSDSRTRDGAVRAAREPGVRDDGDVSASVRDFHARVGVAQSLQAAGDAGRFTAVRDSLVFDVNEFIRTHPHAEHDPEFARLLNALSALDTLAVDVITEDGYSALDDSLALANALWPELGAADDGPLFSKNDTTFPHIQNSRIDFWLTYFTGPGRERFERALYRMQLHRPTVSAILDEMDLPQELICIAFVESGFAMKAVSSAKAVGPWQFINGTARRYGLRVNWWYDERCDVVASTYAAGHYLQDLHSIWGDWFLAFAAYNCGEYRVARQVARQKTENFWELDLPLQTERYVPKFLAALTIMRDPEQYGFTIPRVEPIRFDLVTVTEATDLEQLARCAGTSAEVIRDMNPHLRRGATPPNMEIHVKVPHGSGEMCERNLAELPADQRVSWKEHKVKKGDTLSGIATRYGTSVEALRDTNGMKRRSLLQVGQVVMIPVAGGHIPPASGANSKPSYMNPRPSIDRDALERYAQRASSPPAGKKRIVYTVRPNDTLSEIAARHGTSASRIRSWNDLSRRHIYPGQKLAIYVPQSRAVEHDAPETTQAAAVDESRFEKQRHVVQRGETFYSISKSYGVGMHDLMAWNGRGRNSTIRPGDVLVVWRPRSVGSVDAIDGAELRR
jgi:membrane-bound lytic murein transglycosylase D